MNDEPEYGSDEYIMKRWDGVVSDLPEDVAAMVAHMLENQEKHGKTPLQILAERFDEDLDDNG